MTRIASSIIVILAIVLAFFGSRAISAPDKYTVQVPDGLAFTEFRGYDALQRHDVVEGALFRVCFLCRRYWGAI
jgi:hypothetical protein